MLLSPSRPSPPASCLTFAALTALTVILLHISGTRQFSLLYASSEENLDCTESQAGAIRFDHTTRRFQGCDGVAWSLLAFCCAPGRPDPPRLMRTDDCELWLHWRAPAAHGSPISHYSLEMGAPMGVGEMATAVAAARRTVYRGPALGSCVAGLGARLNGALFTVTAHAVGGSSEPSEPVELQPAPSPVTFEAVDDGSCSFGPADVLKVRFDRPTSRAGGEEVLRINPHSVGMARALDDVSPEGVARLLRFSSAVGPLVGRWRNASLLELRMATHHALDADKARSSHSDPLLQHLVVSVRAEGNLAVAPPAISLPATGSSPPLVVPNCFLEGFETPQLGKAWVIESRDLAAYSVSFDTQSNVTRHSGRQSLRLSGGSSVEFDGLRARLPSGSKPRRVAFWVRAASKANAGYFTLGQHSEAGGSIQSSVLFFHLRADGSAGLLSSTGGWTRGEYTPGEWLHVRIDIEWPYRRAQLWINGERIASNIGFASSSVQHADELHLFNFDKSVVWWDDISVAL